jgi:hypothetical protein
VEGCRRPRRVLLIHPLKLRFHRRDLFQAWLVATVFSGLPSTLHALVSGTDVLEATRAAGAMLLPAATDTATLLAAAALVHPAVSLFWAVVFGLLLPDRHVALWAVTGAAAVALLDLRVIAPLLFPAVAALPFWPQFADHLMWGALLGGTLQLRRRRAGRTGEGSRLHGAGNREANQRVE